MKKIQWVSGFILVLSCFLVSGCLNLTGEKLDEGTVKDSTYHNNYFGMDIKIPKHWQVQDQETSEKITDEGVSLMAGKDAGMKAVMDISKLKTVNLLTVYKYPLGSAHGYNPNFALVAEKIFFFQPIPDGKTYLTMMKEFMKKGQLHIDFVGDIEPVKLGGRDFYVQKTELKYGKFLIKQKYYAYITKSYSFSIVVSWVGDSQLTELESILKTVNFDK